MLLLRVILLLVPSLSWAAIDAYEFERPGDEQRFRQLIFELRCPKCQNQNIADSNAPLAADLRQKVHTMIVAGRSDSEILAYMIERYGDFVTYRPPLKPATWLLWFGPITVLVLIALGVLIWIRRRSQEAVADIEPTERARLDTLLNQLDQQKEER